MNASVTQLAAGSSTQTELSLTPGFNHPGAVAVDTGGTVYVADDANNRVLKIAAGDKRPLNAFPARAAYAGAGKRTAFS
jgi:DNA-binding beta-propeller fold protein YncE